MFFVIGKNKLSVCVGIRRGCRGWHSANKCDEFNQILLKLVHRGDSVHSEHPSTSQSVLLNLWKFAKRKQSSRSCPKAFSIQLYELVLQIFHEPGSVTQVKLILQSDLLNFLLCFHWFSEFAANCVFHIQLNLSETDNNSNFLLPFSSKIK